MAVAINNLVLFDFSESAKTINWMVVNDGVMGGLSDGKFALTEKGTAIFQGNISLENNGGFSSLRYNTGEINVKGFSKLELFLKGDGKKYQVRIRENRNDYYAYISTFTTSGEWEKIEIDMKSMYPSFRGRTLNLPNYKAEKMVELTFLIGNKTEENFVIELKRAVLK